MRPEAWNPPVELSAAEQVVVQRIKRAKLFTFLRRRRHELFDAAFQEEWGALSRESERGAAPVPPAKLALVTLVQASTGASDDEAIEALVMDRRWQLVLDCLDAERSPFGKGTLVRFRQALIAKELDRRLIERTVELATRDETRELNPRHLRAALDSSPLWGAGRVEDTYNLLGHALRKAVGVLARQQGRELAAVATELGADVIAGPSLKAALDLDWDDPEQQARALVVVLGAVEACERRLAPAAPGTVPAGVPAALAVAHQVEAQDVVKGAAGQPVLRQGVAPERRISVEDADLRHGRKSKSLLVDGYKRHVLHDLDRQLIVAVGVTPANAPEATVTDQIAADIARRSCRSPAKPGRCATGRMAVSPKPLSHWTGRPARSAARTRSACRSSRGRRSNSPPTLVRPVPCALVARAASTVAASRFTRTNACSKNCATASRPRPGAPSCANAPPWNIAWPISASDRGAMRATSASAKTSSICVAPPPCRTSTSSCDSPN
jgi:hypothetical protein